MKKELREKIILMRNNLSDNEVKEKSDLIFAKLNKLDIYKNARGVMLYISFRNEVLTEPIINDLFNSGKRVFIPVTVPKTKELIVSELIDLKEDLEIGTFGVREPKKECLRPSTLEEIDLIIVPGVAFDPLGYRIGYGAGYYDRFLTKLSNSVPKISLAFDLQIIDKIPYENYDIPVDLILTESGFFKCFSQI